MKQQIKNGEWWQGDCLELMKDIPDGSVDMILCDLPYGTTQNKWDTIIPFEPLWEQYWRVCKSNAAIVLTGVEPFSSALRLSNIENYKYDWIWKKDKATGHLNSKKQPMRETELISVFYKNQCVYNPQLTDKNPNNIRPSTTKRNNNSNYGKMDRASKRSIPITKSYPKNILTFPSIFGGGKSENIGHPTQKPVALFEYLIKTYTNENDLVLDNTAGSGTTAVAAENTNRKWLCIERDSDYSQKAIERIMNNEATNKK